MARTKPTKRTNNRIIDAEPAPYPKSSAPEMDAVTTLIYILNKERVKFDLKILDKFPNTDGIFELVTKQQRPIGKLDLQIKFLSEGNYLKPKYQCTKPFLAYCEASILPVILITVDVANNKGYWLHISRQVLLKSALRLKGESVNIDMPVHQIISETDLSYLIGWELILKKYLSRLVDYEAVIANLAKEKRNYNKLKKKVSPILGVCKKEFNELHIFLDYYNGLLERDFPIIKEVFYPDYWKFGIAYRSYRDDRIVYALYPIKHDYNDIQIKQLNADDSPGKDTEFNAIHYISSNPIRFSPLQHAYKCILDDLKEIVDNKVLLPVDQFSAKEYLSAFIDYYHEFLGFPAKAKFYQLTMLKAALSHYLPLFAEEYFATARDEHGAKSKVINLDFWRMTIGQDDITDLAAKVKYRLDNKENPGTHFSFASEAFNLRYVYNLIGYMEQLGIDSFEHPYPVKNYPKREVVWKWEAYTPQKTLSVVRTIYQELPVIYDRFINEYLPALKGHCQFFNDFNLLVINLYVQEKATAHDRRPRIEMFYLKNLSEAENEPQIQIYLEGRDETPLRWKTLNEVKDRIVLIGEQRYQIVSARSSVLDFVFEKTPLLHSLYNLLKEDLQNYFEQYVKKSLIFGR